MFFDGFWIWSRDLVDDCDHVTLTFRSSSIGTAYITDRVTCNSHQPYNNDTIFKLKYVHWEKSDAKTSLMLFSASIIVKEEIRLEQDNPNEALMSNVIKNV